MNSQRGTSQRRKRRSAGTALVESAFTLLPTFALILAFVDFSIMLFRRSTLQNAVREGCRYAVTFQRQTQGGVMLGQDASVAGVVERYAFNMVTASDSPQHIFVKYYSPTDLNTPITNGGNIPGNVVEVSVQNISFGWLAPLSGSYGAGVPFFRNNTPLSVAVYSYDILGGFPAGVGSIPR